jgi:hypothetical protein
MKIIIRLACFFFLVFIFGTSASCRKETGCWYCESFHGSWGQGHQAFEVCDEYYKEQLERDGFDCTPK